MTAIFKDNNTIYHDDAFFPAFDGKKSRLSSELSSPFLLYFNIQKGFSEAS